jgi:hypothetical protein
MERNVHKVRKHLYQGILLLYDPSCSFFFTDPNVAKKISSVGVSSCADLYCSHEEADTRMLLHAMHADKEFGRKNTKGRIIVKSPDTKGPAIYRLSPGYGISPNSL